MRTKAVVFVVLAAVASGTCAQSYPTRPVRVVLPFPAGSGADVVTRTVTQRLSQAWEQPVVVDNRPGAGGTLGAAVVAKSSPDGYVLLAHSSTYAVSAALYSNLPYDSTRDLVGLASIGTQPYLLVVGPSAGYKSVSDLVAAARARSGKMDFGSAGVGSSTHLVAERFRSAAGIGAVHVPYKNPIDANTDTMTGRITYWFPPLGLVLPLVRDGKMLALGTTSGRRVGHLPQVPTFAEAGFSGLDDTNWFGIWAPSGTPSAVTAKIARDVAAAVAAPDVRDRLLNTGTDPISMTQAEFNRFVRVETENAVRIVKAAGIKAE